MTPSQCDKVVLANTTSAETTIDTAQGGEYVILPIESAEAEAQDIVARKRSVAVPSLDLTKLMRDLDRSIEAHASEIKAASKLRGIFGFSTSV